ncbi:hypothetical protein [Microtetraspora niveoalba]|uniref:hypothetical protein n=1 Tax=Microtetraspora niveoalba TaxID=46175 RepID=UPI00082E7355|nr:hypothetical protein [Microtetraspora niveoalba]
MAEAGEPFTTPMPRVPPEPPPAAWRPRLVYTALAGAGTVVAIVLVFAAFSGDRPGAGPASLHQGRSASAPATGPAASASPSSSPAAVRLPPVPAALSMVVHPGRGTPAASFVVDERSGIGYAGFGPPWRAAADPAPFAYAQRAGRALIVSSPMPGAVPQSLTTRAEYRKVAARAAKWTLRFQPEGASLAWTASQPLRRGSGWLLGYRVTYRVGGRGHTSEAIVAVVGTSGTKSAANGGGSGAGKKPALLFATVPDTHPGLYRDLNMLVWTLRPM